MENKTSLMKKYLVFENMVRGAGIGHTLMCYNNAVQMALSKNASLIVPRCQMGHGLGNDFAFETFFGLDCHTKEFINELKQNIDEIEIIAFGIDPLGCNGCSQSSDFSLTKDFFMSRFLKTIDDKENKFRSHLVSGKITIAMHIRRGDIVSKRAFKHYQDDTLRIIHDEWYISSLKEVLSINNYTLDDVHVNVYTELQSDGLYYNGYGNVCDLRKVFDVPNCSFYCNGNMWESLYNMFKADIFIGGSMGVPITVSFFRNGFKRATYVKKQGLGANNKYEYVHLLQ